MSLAVGALTWEEMQTLLWSEQSDLEYSMLAYGSAVFRRAFGRKTEAEALLQSILPRDSFWISYAYIAAWNDRNKTTGMQK